MTTGIVTIPTDSPVTKTTEEIDLSKFFTKLTKNKLHCTLCEKIVSIRASANHLRMHSSSQPYSCPICDKKFAHRSSVNRHKKSHDKPQLFQCSVCEKGFSNKSTFDIHLELHKTPVISYPCSLCDKSFPTDTELKEHLSDHGEIQYIQIADATGRPQICLQSDFTVVSESPKSSENIAHGSFESTPHIVDLSRAFVTSTLREEIPSHETQDSYHKSDSEGVLYNDIQSYGDQDADRSEDVHFHQNENGVVTKLFVTQKAEGELDSHRELDRADDRLVKHTDENTDSHQDSFSNEALYESQRSGHILENSSEINIGEECLLRKMLASKIVGSVNAMSAKRGLSSTAVRSSVETEPVRKYSADVTSADSFTKFSDRFVASYKEEEEEEESRKDIQPAPDVPSEDEARAPVEVPSTAAGEVYNSGADEPKSFPEISYINNVDLRNKIPHIRYFVNFRKQNIFYAQKQDDGTIKDYSQELQNAHILQNAQILQNAHLLQNVHDLQNATLLQNAQFLQSAHILQNAPTLVCVDAPMLERKDSPETNELSDSQIQLGERGTALEKLQAGHVYRYIDTTPTDTPKTTDSPSSRDAEMYEDSINIGRSAQNISLGKRHLSENEEHDVPQRRDTLSYSDLPPKVSSAVSLETEDPYTFNLSTNSRDSSPVGEGTTIDAASPDVGVVDPAGALQAGVVPKRARKSGSTSSKRNRSDSGYKSFKCTSCDRYFPCSSALERHRQSKHPPHVVCHTCTICGKALYHPSHIYIHMRTHV